MEIRCRVVSNEDVDPAIVVKVAGDNAETVETIRIRDARLLRDIRKRAIAVVLIERGPKTISLPCSARATNTNRIHEAFCLGADRRSPGLRAVRPQSHQKETPWITKVIYGVFNPFGGYVITAPGVRSTGYSHGS